MLSTIVMGQRVTICGLRWALEPSLPPYTRGRQPSGEGPYIQGMFIGLKRLWIIIVNIIIIIIIVVVVVVVVVAVVIITVVIPSFFFASSIIFEMCRERTPRTRAATAAAGLVLAAQLANRGDTHLPG